MLKTFFKRTVALMLCATLLFCSFAVDVFAEETIIIKTLTINSAMSAAPSAASVDESDEALINSINSQLKAYNTSASILKFKLPYNQESIDKIKGIMSGELPECFHLDVSFQISVIGGYIFQIIPTYSYTKSEYQAMLADCEDAAKKMLIGVEGNTTLTDEEKLLILHDRIALHCEYDMADQKPQISHSMYGVFVNKVAVCQGYALAYSYLLDKIGVKNRYCSSVQINHAWNIVELNGKEYHVDITWDDPVWDVTGRVIHNNFLISTNKLIENGHNATDFDTSPTDSTYDTYYWQDVQTGFALLNDEIYYLCSDSKQYIYLKRCSDNKILYQTKHYWWASSSSIYSGNHARLSVVGSKLLFSLSNGVYSFDPQKNKVKLIYSKPAINEYFNIYGFTYADGLLVCDLYNSPYFNSDTKKNYQYKVPYHDVGNINDDGNINLEDVVILARALAGWSVEYSEDLFDVNGDKAKNLLDLVRLSQYVAEWEGIELY